MLGRISPAADPDRVAANPPRPLEADEVKELIPNKIAELHVRTQDRIEITAKLDAVLLAGLDLGPPDDTQRQTLILKGTVQREPQREILVRLMADMLQTESFWSTMDEEFTIDASQLTTTKPMPGQGDKSLNQAIDFFFRNQYDNADKYFTHALAEMPEREVLHYWKAVTAIALKQPERAERRLEILCRRNPKGSVSYASELQRLQGPLRNSLRQMEEQVRLKIREGTSRISK